MIGTRSELELGDSGLSLSSSFTTDREEEDCTYSFLLSRTRRGVSFALLWPLRSPETLRGSGLKAALASISGSWPGRLRGKPSWPIEDERTCWVSAASV